MTKERELVIAVKAQDNLATKKLLSSKNKKCKKVNVDYQDGDGMSALHQATLVGNLTIMCQLLDANASVSVCDSSGRQPIHFAAWQGRVDPILLLLKFSANPNATDGYGQNSLHFAANHGHSDIVKILLNAGGDVAVRDQQEKTPFDCSCEKGWEKVVSVLLPSCVNQLISNPQDQLTNAPLPPLHRASHHGHVKVICCLLDSGIVDINRKISTGTALHEAVLSNKPSVVKILLQRGIDLSIKNSFGQTAAQLVEQLYNSNQIYRNTRWLFTNESDTFSQPDILSHRPYVTIGNDSEFPPPPPLMFSDNNKDADRDSGISPQHSPNRLSSQSLSSAAESGVCSPRQSLHSGSSSSSSLPSLNEVEPASIIYDKLKDGCHPTDPHLINAWLQSIQLSELYPVFLDAGYDLPTVSRMTPSDVNALGIQKPSHLKRLKSEINRLHFANSNISINDSLSVFLETINLKEYEHLFIKEGYSTVASLIDLTFEDFEEFGIKKLGHLKKLLLAVNRIRKLNQTPIMERKESLEKPDVVTVQVLTSPSGNNLSIFNNEFEEIAYSGTLVRHSKSTFSKTNDMLKSKNTYSSKTPPPLPKRSGSMRLSTSCIRPKPVNPPKIPSLDDSTIYDNLSKQQQTTIQLKPTIMRKSISTIKLPTPSLQAHSVAISSINDIHFANENYGTIKQKSVTFEKDIKEQQCKESSYNGNVSDDCPNILSELDIMLQGLSDELDATISQL